MKTNISRKNFLRITALGFFTLFSLAFVKRGFAFITRRSLRTTATYKQDGNMPLRKSQDNPMINKIYKDFLGHTNSHKAHELLHTTYTDRSARIKKLKQEGVRINLSGL